VLFKSNLYNSGDINHLTKVRKVIVQQ